MYINSKSYVKYHRSAEENTVTYTYDVKVLNIYSIETLNKFLEGKPGPPQGVYTQIAATCIILNQMLGRVAEYIIFIDFFEH